MRALPPSAPPLCKDEDYGWIFRVALSVWGWKTELPANKSSLGSSGGMCWKWSLQELSWWGFSARSAPSLSTETQMWHKISFTCAYKITQPTLQESSRSGLGHVLTIIWHRDTWECFAPSTQKLSNPVSASSQPSRARPSRCAEGSLIIA